MKQKSIIFAMTAALLFAGCGTSSSGGGGETTSNAKIANVDIEEQVIADQDGIKITATGTSVSKSNNFHIDLKVENNSNQTIKLGVSKMYVNGFLLDYDRDYSSIGNKDGLAPGETTEDAYFSCDLETFQLLGTDTVQEISVVLRVIDAETRDEIFLTDLISLQTSAYESIDTTVEGYEILSNSDVRVTAGKYVTLGEDDEQYDAFVVYVENLSDYTLEPDVYSLEIDGGKYDNDLSTPDIEPNEILICPIYAEVDGDENDTYGLANVTESGTFDLLKMYVSVAMYDNDDYVTSHSKTVLLSIDDNDQVVAGSMSTEGLVSLTSTEVMNQDGVTITAESFTLPFVSDSDGIYGELKLTVDNQTDGDVGVIATKLNGVTYHYYSQLNTYTESENYAFFPVVEAHQTEDVYVSVGESFLEELGIDSFASITLNTYFNYDDDAYYYGEITPTVSEVTFDGDSSVNAFNGEELLNYEGIIYKYEGTYTDGEYTYVAISVENTTEEYAWYEFEEITAEGTGSDLSDVNDGSNGIDPGDREIDRIFLATMDESYSYDPLNPSDVQSVTFRIDVNGWSYSDGSTTVTVQVD